MSNPQFTGIQILRFVAAMLVVLMHTIEAITLRSGVSGTGHLWLGGSAGVDIFFVISGFVMAMSTSEISTGGSKRLSAAWIFIKRRLMRIAPLYWFYTLLKAAMVLALPSLALRSSVDPEHLLASMLFIPATSPWGLVQPTLPVGWTLNFEMLFYGVFALSIALGMARIRFALLAFLMIFFAGYLFPDAVPLHFYAQSLVFEFILGMGIAHVFQNYRHLAPVAGLMFLLIGLVFMFGIGWSDSADRLSTWGAGAALMVMGAVWLEPWTARSPMTLQLSFLGDASYSIYLSHTFVVPAAVLVFNYLGIQNGLIIIPATCLIVIFSGCLSYVWLERPMTRYLKRTLFRAPKLSFTQS